MTNNESSATPNWQQDTIDKLLMSTIEENRRRRRWSNFFKILLFIYLFCLLWLIWPTSSSSTSSTSNKQLSHISVVKINGEIASDESASASNILSGLQSAYKDKMTKAVVLSINSPGGSPVQAEDVYDQVMYYRNKYPDIKVYAVCSDICTSAAYYIASSANEVYADHSSLVGSIGVLMEGFGFVDGMNKLGIQRRLFTSGDHKGFLDPFSPLNPGDVTIAQTMLDNVHQQFIKNVQLGRGNRLVKNNPDLYSGLAWTGEQALPLGLIDGYGNLQSVSRDVIKNTNVVDYTVKPTYLDRIAGRFGAEFYHQFASQFFQDKLS